MGTSDGGSGEGDTTRITSPGARVGSAASPAYTEDSARGVSYGSTREALLGGSESMYLRAAMENVANRNGLAPGDRELSLNERQTPNFRGVCVHVRTGYNRVEGNRRASRNGLASGLPPKNPPLRFATLSSL
jgi:hypothetical protein